VCLGNVVNSSLLVCGCCTVVFMMVPGASVNDLLAFLPPVVGGGACSRCAYRLAAGNRNNKWSANQAGFVSAEVELGIQTPWDMGVPFTPG
jgi:hypothetical protein